MSNSVIVTVPATTANLGPGFDCIGAALTLYSQFKFSQVDSSLGEKQPNPVNIRVTGVDANQVSTDAGNLAYQAFVKLYQYLDQTPPAVEMEIELGYPLARGLGSSATAIVGGLMAADRLAGSPLSQTELINLAIAIEGHPDNVVPAILGNCQLAVAASDNHWEICEIPWHSSIVPIVAIPNFKLSTTEARQVLPSEYSKADTVFNTAHFGLLVRGLETGRGEWLRVAMQDKIHQPYRKALIQGYEAVRSAAINASAYELVISGAGPTLLALTSVASAPDVVVAMADAWTSQGVEADVRSLKIDRRGTKVIKN